MLVHSSIEHLESGGFVAKSRVYLCQTVWRDVMMRSAQLKFPQALLGLVAASCKGIPPSQPR